MSNSDVNSAGMLPLPARVLHFGSYGTFAAMLGFAVYNLSYLHINIERPFSPFTDQSWFLFCFGLSSSIVLNILLLIAWRGLNAAQRVYLPLSMIVVNAVLIYFLQKLCFQLIPLYQ